MFSSQEDYVHSLFFYFTIYFAGYSRIRTASNAHHIWCYGETAVRHQVGETESVPKLKGV